MHKVMSQIQIDANRRNAKKSTGPCTPAGKACSARNNTRHGFFTRALVLSSGPSAEDPAEFERLRAAFRNDFQPASHYERVLVDVLATCMWRARRVRRFESHLFRDASATTSPDSSAPAPFEGNALMSLIRYENRLTRQFERAWNLLKACKKKDSLLSIQKRLETRASERSTPNLKSDGKTKNANSNPTFNTTSTVGLPRHLPNLPQFGQSAGLPGPEVICGQSENPSQTCKRQEFDMATLVITDGPGKGQKFALAGCRVAMVGRDAGCSFQIVDPELSRFHLQIRHAEEQNTHCANDFQSKNGVFVNGKKIAAETALADGDVIVIGGSTIVYSVEDVQDAQRVIDAWKRAGQGHLKTQTGS